MRRAKYRNSLSSNGIKITESKNYEIQFPINRNGEFIAYAKVPFINIESFDNGFSFKLNDEETIHCLEPNSIQVFEDLIIVKKITILESGVKYKWIAFF